MKTEAQFVSVVLASTDLKMSVHVLLLVQNESEKLSVPVSTILKMEPLPEREPVLSPL